jgi:hypothetical protein
MKFSKLLLPLAMLVLATTSHAHLIHIRGEWSGAAYSDGASAVATFTLDTSRLKRSEAIVLSMTPAECRRPDKIRDTMQQRGGMGGMLGMKGQGGKFPF